ncbi:MAG: glycoside hydrolase N-terminal domain-containing protein, partial [Kiritimatiellae bacterium]|nr:glycoside hydrolase N-terminal domain-containing protein [Kiritimatiellia bacterium]
MKSWAISLKGLGQMVFPRVFVLFPLLMAMSACAASGETVRYRLFDTKAASDDKTGWEWQSYPLGCGYFGWNVFGIPDNERIQVTHNAMVTYRNQTNALEIRIRTGHAKPVRYRRELDVSSAVAKTEYSCDGVDYCRECFTSYPARTGVMHLTASREGALSFDVLAQIPFPVPFGDKEGFGRKGTVESSGNEILIEQEMEFQGIKFAAVIKVLSDGKVVPKDGRLQVSGATAATVLF